MISKFFLISLTGLLLALSDVRGLAQSQTFLSNLGESPGGSFAVSQSSWAAQAFNVGDNIVGTRNEGFQLNSIQVLMDAPIGNPSGFSLSIYDIVTRDEGPSRFIGSLVGTPPNTAGVFTFTASNITLGPKTYWVVMTSSSPIAMGSYSWRESSSGNFEGADRWSPYPSHDFSSDGLTWTINGNKPLQFAVYATAIPEPSSLVLIGLSCSFLFTRLARKSRSKTLRQP